MKKPAETVTYSYVFGPGEAVTMSYPPHYETPPYYETPPCASVWTSLTADIETGPIDMAVQSVRIETVGKWVEQLVWKALGKSLLKAEEIDKRNTKLKVRVDASVASLIMKAIEIKAKSHAKPKSKNKQAGRNAKRRRAQGK